MTALHDAGEWFSRQAETLKDNPALLGFVVALWMTTLVLVSGGNPVLAFLVLVPVLTATGYAIDGVVRRIFGDGSDAERSAEREYEAEDEERAIERLRSRYAAGEIDHDEFERRLERLVETESYDEPTADRERMRIRERETE
ncbi:protein of unknown function [Halopelagius inordinatus]|uniref:SHOCT domain-containing protein n=1 Tax=Halopelagius inordinatus TaxID=553467 RepID=A0A1I2TEQ3_9EURY|nr:SHOCT domain-containing protein [Halopelagius inordinatus]SFG63318.1 protein of unknown function [Halopelagius inordinatus]